MAVVKIKICGITNIKDALAAVDMGADLLGFNFYQPSPRYVRPDRARSIINKLPTCVDTVGVFVNADTERIEEVAADGLLNWIQLHGDETPEFCDSLSWLYARTIKAVRVKSSADVKTAKKYFTDAVLFDAYDPELYGGTGKTFDWNMINTFNKRIFLAGGITPENAARAVETGLYGIDVCSGIEFAPGKKDHKKMKQLFENIKHVRG